MTARIDPKKRKLKKNGRPGAPYKPRSDSKYKEEFARALATGIRYKEGLSIIELCRKWRITTSTYDTWLKDHPEFARAAEIGAVDYASWWHEYFKDVAVGNKKGNSACMTLAMSCVPGIGWNTKVDVNHKNEQTIGAININILEAPKRAMLEQQPTTIIDAEEFTDDVNDESSNVVRLHDN